MVASCGVTQSLLWAKRNTHWQFLGFVGVFFPLKNNHVHLAPAHEENHSLIPLHTFCDISKPAPGGGTSLKHQRKQQLHLGLVTHRISPTLEQNLNKTNQNHPDLLPRNIPDAPSVKNRRRISFISSFLSQAGARRHFLRT